MNMSPVHFLPPPTLSLSIDCFSLGYSSGVVTAQLAPDAFNCFVI